MKITAIERSGSRKYSFYIDGDYSFFLTDAELREYGALSQVKALLEDADKAEDLSISLSEDAYIKINESVLTRGKRYSLGLLSDRDYTVTGLTGKIIQAGYSEDDASAILDYVSSFNYVDDVRYACSYIRSKESTKSRKYIENQLMLKGVSRKDIQAAFEKVEEERARDGISQKDVACEAITKLLRKKLDPDEFNNQDKITKVIASLLRSGYNYSDIKQSLNDYIDGGSE